jgi:hypothetical protein
MARKSAESLAVVPVTDLPSRMNPPEFLPLKEAEVWRAVVATKPLDWFQADSAPILTEYCRAVVMCNRLADMIEVASPEDLHNLLIDRDREAKRVAQLAVKMRLTQQSRYTPMASSTAAKAPSAGKVWQFGT